MRLDPCHYSLDGRVYQHCAPSGFEINANSPGSRKGISMIKTQSLREVALQIGTSTLRFEIPSTFNYSQSEPVDLYGITCILPEGDSIVCTATITGYPLSIRLNASIKGFEWFWLHIETDIAFKRSALEISNMDGVISREVKG